jgi:hypothetical protein
MNATASTALVHRIADDPAEFIGGNKNDSRYSAASSAKETR